jgi:hypothetical protein
MAFWCALALLAVRLVLALALIPPWQQPDEPTHVAYVELQRHHGARPDAASDPARETEILRSLVAYDWWEHRAVGFTPPTPMPERFSELGRIGGLRGRVAVDVIDTPNPPLFHGVVAQFLRWLPSRSVVADMYTLRAISAILGMLTLWVAWRAAREWLGEAGGLTVALLLALHPQFALVATSASPDGAANFFAACAWWAAVAAVSRERIVLPLAALWGAAIAAAVADRVGVPLVGLALVASLAAVVTRVPRQARWPTRTTIAVVLGSAVMLAAGAWGLAAFGSSYGIGYVFSRGLVPVPGAMTWDSFVGFTWILHRSWWHAIGWGRYAPPAWWVLTATLITAAAVAGLGRTLRAGDIGDRRTRMLFAVGAAGVAIQLAAIYWTYFRMDNGAQGRYLFPMLVPSLVLLWIGISAWVPPERRMHAAAALVLLFGALDLTAWGVVAIPAYYASF